MPYSSGAFLSFQSKVIKQGKAYIGNTPPPLLRQRKRKKEQHLTVKHGHLAHSGEAKNSSRQRVLNHWKEFKKARDSTYSKGLS